MFPTSLNERVADYKHFAYMVSSGVVYKADLDCVINTLETLKSLCEKYNFEPPISDVSFEGSVKLLKNYLSLTDADLAGGVA